MAILNDVTRLLDGLPSTGDVITPQGSGAPPGFGKMQDNVQIDLADPAMIQQGDVLHWQGASYAVSQIYEADLVWESMNTGLSETGIFSYIVQLAVPQDPAKTLTIWLPEDNRLPLNYDLPFLPPATQIQGTAASLEVRGLTPITSIPWEDVALNDNIDTICFADDAMIETAAGPVAAGALRKGDLVMTRDAGLQPIRWIAARRIGARALARQPHLAPVLISAGALGAGLPARDLRVSPQHRILVRSAIAQRMFGAQEVLVAAKQLSGLDGIRSLPATDEGGDGITYVHFLFDAHQIIYANGAEAESLYTGPAALRTLGPAALREIHTLFPELAEATDPPRPARPLIAGREGRSLAARHMRNSKPLLG
ncbi:Hint domain-containing protein [Paracoccus cavernae]|uniref:Hint domain-containing protein n=1 Tax=Paracoccus cavernae TaxID=1571207 RepID=UPI0035F36C2F